MATPPRHIYASTLSRRDRRWSVHRRRTASPVSAVFALLSAGTLTLGALAAERFLG